MGKMMHISTEIDHQISKNPNFVLKNCLYQKIEHLLFKIIHE